MNLNPPTYPNKSARKFKAIDSTSSYISSFGNVNIDSLPWLGAANLALSGGYKSSLPAPLKHTH